MCPVPLASVSVHFMYFTCVLHSLMMVSIFFSTWAMIQRDMYGTQDISLSAFWSLFTGLSPTLAFHGCFVRDSNIANTKQFSLEHLQSQQFFFLCWAAFFFTNFLLTWCLLLISMSYVAEESFLSDVSIRRRPRSLTTSMIEAAALHADLHRLGLLPLTYHSNRYKNTMQNRPAGAVLVS